GGRRRRPGSCFFQAEDGIRDFHVTGVQTCALPIWRRRALAAGAGSRATHARAARTTRPAGLPEDQRWQGPAPRGARAPTARLGQIGRASCRERRENSAGTVLLEKRLMACVAITDVV